MAISNLNSLLNDIYVRYVQIKDHEFQLHYRVIDQVFHQLHQKMKEVDPYYKKYSSTIQYCGSHYDNVRIVKPNEFDINIVIGLPVSTSVHPNEPKNSEVLIELKSAGFVQLKMGAQFQALPQNESEWVNDKAVYDWMDGAKYLQRSKFMDWFKSVVSRALNTYSADCRSNLPMYQVDGVQYTVRKSESGPAMTLIIEASNGFQLDVDLVPVLEISGSRWPLARKKPRRRNLPLPKHSQGDWLLVPKSISNGKPHDEARSWRISRPNQERELIHNSEKLRQTWRLMKKLRDSLGMDKIASYYIKNLFLREITTKKRRFWKKSDDQTLFKYMVTKFCVALVDKNIRSFWIKKENLLARVEDRTLIEYAARLLPLLQVLEDPQEYQKVARYLLTSEEFIVYNARYLHI